jgi:zinc/manganese transport system permease protein
VSTVLSIIGVWAGLAISAMFNMPPSFPIVTIVCVIWLAVWLVVNRTGTPSRALPGVHGAAASESGRQMN